MPSPASAPRCSSMASAMFFFASASVFPWETLARKCRYGDDEPAILILFDCNFEVHACSPGLYTDLVPVFKGFIALSSFGSLLPFCPCISRYLPGAMQQLCKSCLSLFGFQFFLVSPCFSYRLPLTRSPGQPAPLHPPVRTSLSPSLTCTNPGSIWAPIALFASQKKPISGSVSK